LEIGKQSRLPAKVEVLSGSEPIEPACSGEDEVVVEEKGNSEGILVVVGMGGVGVVL